ncbi:MAG: hypothetical protein A2992_10010 [Elusimicrobia bacterium RIFCSPLOWO2_01_FULL_59_12]|nr:MAG: hypothetical protein A2992_10010 [Elusimicrobia bacterium RIFCSPLOWO2_01_FULL_59_12]
MKLAAVIQARYSSTRLPGKVLMQAQGKPLLGFLIERLRLSRKVRTLILATSDQPEDDALEAFCTEQNLLCYRGSLKNVARRFHEACQHFQLDAFVRVNADSPLIDPRLLDRAVDLFEQEAPDVVTNIQNRTFPKGESVEMVKVPAFQRALSGMSKPEHFEHVTAYFYERPELFKILNFTSGGAYNDIRLTVDTRDDFLTFTSILQQMTRPHWEYGWKDLLPLYKEVAARPQTI